MRVRSLLHELPVFVAVASAGGFTEAARALDMTPAGVSRAIARLEDEVGVALFARTTRRVTLTEEGERFLPHAREALRQVDVGRDALAFSRAVAAGALRVSLSFVLGRFLLARLDTLLARHPGLSIHLHYTDRLSRLVDERVDVALRIGDVRDPSLVARPLTTTRWCTVASPAYLARHGHPASPDALATHETVKYRNARGAPVEWVFAKGEGSEVVPTPTRLDVDQGEALVDAAIAGVGIAQVFTFMAAPHLASGALVELFPERRAPGPPLTMLCLPGRQRLPRVRAFTAALADSVRDWS